MSLDPRSTEWTESLGGDGVTPGDNNGEPAEGQVFSLLSWNRTVSRRPPNGRDKAFPERGADGADGHMGVDFCRSASG